MYICICIYMHIVQGRNGARATESKTPDGDRLFKSALWRDNTSYRQGTGERRRGPRALYLCECVGCGLRHRVHAWRKFMVTDGQRMDGSQAVKVVRRIKEAGGRRK